ncbi:hypothetical protein BGZ58_004362 [Dissophora ornata]|nr:hypothetical protein BGZ58_004362 [Dissophora ornata]
MRAATAGFESTFQQQLCDPSAGSPIESVVSPEHRLKSRLQKFIRIPPSVAQTHTRMTTIRLGFRVNRRKQRAAVTAALSPKTASPFAPNSTATVEDSISSSPEALAALAALGALEPKPRHEELHHRNSNSSTRSGSTKHENYSYGFDNDSNHDGDDEGESEAVPMPPREGFTVAYSLFAKVKARVLHNNRPQFQQSLAKSHPSEESGSSSQEESAASKGSSSDATEVESNASNSNPCTLSAGTFGNIDSHDLANDSDGTVTDLDDPITRVRQRKYSPGSRLSSVGPEEGTVLSSSPIAAADAPHAEAIAPELLEEVTEVVAKNVEIIIDSDPEDQGQDPVELFEQIFNRQHQSEDAIAASLQELRQLILAYGIPEQPAVTPKTALIRGRCWKLLLEVHHVSAQEYVSLVKQGKPVEYGKIRNDTFRTMATDRNYTTVVEEDSLIRVLCAFAWSTQATSAQDTGVSFTYVQGMNVLAAPFLYTMTEVEAFYSYSNLLKYCCPLYVQPALQGVHCGIKLLEECLCKIDPELYDYLKSKRLSAEVYAFPSVLTICACTPPLEQAMQLWDFLLAWGIHLNIICIIAQLYLIRDDLMSHTSPMKLLRIFPDLEADKIICETIRMVKLLPDELYDLLVRHPYDPTVAEQIGY